MRFWYEKSRKAQLQSFLLMPLALLFAMVSHARRWLYQRQILASYRPRLPVIIVGNLSVGGNGKTPVTLWLAEQLRKRSFRVGIISRGYGSQSAYYPRLVTADDDAREVGDEPLLLAKRSGVPVCIGADRRKTIELLQQQHELDVILSDDGLQHYALQRDVEIVVIDSQRGLGNGLLLPAGALRESASRLKSVDFVIFNGHAPQTWAVDLPPYATMTLQAGQAVNLLTGEQQPLANLTQSPTVGAFAGIGNPERFFQSLEQQGFHLTLAAPLTDHTKPTPEFLQKFQPCTLVLMTEKDAVKCQALCQQDPKLAEKCWYIPVNAQIPQLNHLLACIERKLV